MRKKITSLLFNLLIISIYSQTNPGGLIQNSVNSVAPKSPDAAALFRYTETPVSLYTGVPNISIPIYTIKEGDIEVPISISYHAGGIKVTDEASSVGLGWSLNAGGRVSHIVAGVNDFSLYGYYQIYPRNAIGYLGSPLCLPLPWNPSTYTSAYYTNVFTSTISSDNTYVGYDFQPDLFLINLPGKSYKAYLDMTKTTKPNGSIKFAIAEQPNIDFKLINEPGAGYNFGVTDENGFKYSFDTAEITTNMTGWNTINGLSRILSRIEDTKGNKVDFYTSNVINNYRLTGCKNSRFFYTDPNNWYQQPSVKGLTDCSKQQTGESYIERIEFTNGKIEFDWTTREDINNSKKLSSIKIYNNYKLIKKYDFTYDYFVSTDNLDTNGIATWLGATNNNIFTHRLRLLNVTESLTNEKYSFGYNSNYNLPNKLSFSSDFWGYYNGQSNSDTFIPDPEKYIKGQTIFNVNSFNKDLNGYWYKTNGAPNTYDPISGFNQIYQNYSPNEIHYLSDRRASMSSLAGMLTAIDYPTGGKTVYEYEPNTFSNIPMQSLINDNTRKEASATHIITNINGNLIHTENSNEFKVIGSNIRVNIFAYFGFYFTSNTDQVKNSYWVYIKNKATGEIIKKVYNPNVGSYNATNVIDNVTLQTGNYELGTAYNNDFTAGNILVSGGSNASSNSAVVKYVNEKSIIDGVEYNYSSGGGVRIKSVTSTEKAGATPIVKNYIYDDITDNGTKVTSNGNLSQFPKFFEIESRCYSFDNFGLGHLYTSNPGCFMNLNTPQSPNTYPFKISVYEGASSLGNSTLPQGNHVGYTKVIEQVTGKGRTESYFTNDYTTSCLMMTQKGASLVVGDGDLIKQVSYDNNSKMIKEIFFKYKNNYSDNLNTYVIAGSILEPLTNYGFGFTGGTERLPGLIHNYTINLYKSLLDSTTTREYFPAGANSYLETKSYNTYNSKYLISKQSTLFPDSSTSETNYKYADEVGDTNLLTANMVSIPLETKVIENGKTQSKTKIVYSKNAATSNKILPTSVLSYNLIDVNDVANTNPTPTTEIIYNQYDAHGNLQEYTTKAGVTTSVVWGYNNTKPIAKIEGASYSQLSFTVNDIISYSNYDADPIANNKTAQQTEEELLTKLNAFRTNSLLSGYKISTYSYDPLIGVRSMTPPSGITEYYKYDTTNRLETIVDANGNIHKEFKYNYHHDPSLIFYNEEKSKTFTRTNCSSGSQPGIYNYIVPASTYSSTISKLDADQKALDDIALNGQNFTNQNASCTSITSCLFTFSTSIGTPMYTYGNTTVVNNNVQFDLKFGAPSTNGQSWTSGITIGKIGASCIPSVTRNFDYTEIEGNRKWKVTIDTSGNCNMRLILGTVNTNANLVFQFIYDK
jgi:hypothetical protein